MKRKPLVAILLMLLGVMAIPLAAYAANPDCKMCHPEKAEGKTVHPAVMMGCESCHTGVDANNIPHKFTGAKGLSAQPPDLCFNCHDKAALLGKKFKHSPAASGMCTTCHNPHTSPNEHLLNQPNICAMCHEVDKIKGAGVTNATVHPPVAADMCTSCHKPHSSDNDKMLAKSVPELCFDCHDKTKFIGAVVHAPVGIGLCLSCHKPHNSPNRAMLAAPGSDLCFGCHDKAEFTKKVQHKPVAEGKCTSCHLPHAGQNEAMLERKGNLLCRKCHPDIERKGHAVVGFESAGHPVRGRVDPLRPGKVFGCLSCHLPHSSDSIKLFRYQAESMYDLCLYCHKM